MPAETRREQPSDRVVVAKRRRLREQADRGESQAAKRRSNPGLRLRSTIVTRQLGSAGILPASRH